MTAQNLTDSNDVFSLILESPTDVINALAGADTITVAVMNITVNGGAGNDSFTDDGDFNTWNGGDGNDRLFTQMFNFASGMGTWHGDAGNDAIFVRGHHHNAFGDSGNDSLTIVGRDSVLDGGLGDDVLRDQSMPNAGYLNVLKGGAGNDRLIGNGAASRYIGGAGDDTYTILGNEILDEQAGGGTDTIRTAFARFSLAANFENIAGTNTSSGQTLIGNGHDNAMLGTNFADIISGGRGKDTLIGRGGSDRLAGGMSGDRFDFNAVSDSGTTAATRDVITDFNVVNDVIDLATMDSSTRTAGNNSFVFIKSQAFHQKAGELRFVQVNQAGMTEDVTVIAGDINGDGKADFQIALSGLHTLTAGDFVL